MLVIIKKLALAVAVLAGLPVIGHAAPSYFLARTDNPAFLVQGNALVESNKWASAISNLAREKMDGFATGAPDVQLDGNGDPLPTQKLGGLSFDQGALGTTKAEISGLYDQRFLRAGFIIADNTEAANTGRWDTTGEGVNNASRKYLETVDTFTITFDKAISAFGTYMTDIGDFGGSLSAVLINGNVESAPFEIFNAPAGDNSLNGSLTFWGFTDTMGTYTAIRFVHTSAADGFGFDDMRIGVANQVPPPVPEPASIALLGLGLLLAAARSKKRQ